MSTTLTNGLKLPDKGSVDWYADMQNNYAILDGAVGTIAEHSTQISGKAPLVHTHTTADITDFPVYGTTAGTICEGNDSRLSDARTPVAHTHGKADVTDLFNSANTWTENNTYTAGISYQTSYTLGNPPQNAQAQQVIRVIDIAGTNYLAQIATYQDPALSGLRFTIRDKFDSDGFSPSGSNRNKHFYFLQNTLNRGYLQWEGFVNNNIHPLETNTYNLGTLAYQWNNLYAKGYYYNGVAWGLDKNNKWLTTNLFYGSLPIFLRGSDNDIYNVSPQSLVQSLISFVDKNNATMSNIVFQHRPDATETHRLCLRQQKVTSDGYYGVNLNNLGDFYPDPNNTINLGTSTNKWKSVYSDSYYYGTTAWGLDKANVWSNVNQYSREIQLAGDRNAYIAPMWSGVGSGIAFLSMDAGKQFVFGQRTANANNRSVYDATKGYLVLKTGVVGESNYVEVTPHGSDTRLGDPTNKWKTFNGLNPGALSLPNGFAQDSSWIGDLTIKDGSGYNLKTFTLNGWITINIPNTAGNLVFVNNGCGQVASNEAKGVTGGNCAVFIPVVANVQVSILLVLQTGESVLNAVFSPCLGNV